MRRRALELTNSILNSTTDDVMHSTPAPSDYVTLETELASLSIATRYTGAVSASQDVSPNNASASLSDDVTHFNAPCCQSDVTMHNAPLLAS